MSDAAVYRQNADELLKLALTAADPGERSRLISLAAKWHMHAQDIERGAGPQPEDFSLDLFNIDPSEQTVQGGDSKP
jgi:hypothetical protein